MKDHKDNAKPVAMAVYHYAASVSKQMGGPVHMDGVITRPVISGVNDYHAAKEQIATECGVDDSYLVQVKSLSFVGEAVGGGA